MSMFPSSAGPELKGLEVLKAAAEELRADGRYFVAGYAMARGVHVAWGDMDAMRACVEQASEDFEQVVEDPSSESFERLAALQTWRWPRVESNHRTQIRRSSRKAL
jgi:hypothetical protein